jgi:hypothetical protein
VFKIASSGLDLTQGCTPPKEDVSVELHGGEVTFVTPPPRFGDIPQAAKGGELATSPAKRLAIHTSSKP